MLKSDCSSGASGNNVGRLLLSGYALVAVISTDADLGRAPAEVLPVYTASFAL